MHIDSAVINRMKRAGWSHRRNYFYKRLKDKTMVIELLSSTVYLKIFDPEELELLEPKQKCKSFAEALAKSCQLETKHLSIV
ncbi:MAG: hypothetical protein UV59_C0022G0025 [Candidatus Gottesmanbacteria bacterium GW2011_GWA1_43_11]|uniref:Uncharacterized protein n=1 Tax=Candidatus Gottesmanbacteria bacterium GW2011_GWA1_43_11 TaxID=1618436 RepID=A0A0G1CEV2_9BACT|nr:MAG: hypothetical protein UV59_C0022G0025 [Candidatus Gottesmanbacteria bacterium GW2011_GWA1_43_11]